MYELSVLKYCFNFVCSWLLMNINNKQMVKQMTAALYQIKILYMRGKISLFSLRVSNIAVYFYTFRHNERHNGRPSFIAVIIYNNQWDIIIIVEKIKSINAAAATSSFSSSTSSLCYSFMPNFPRNIHWMSHVWKWFHYAAASAFFSWLWRII